MQGFLAMGIVMGRFGVVWVVCVCVAILRCVRHTLRLHGMVWAGAQTERGPQARNLGSFAKTGVVIGWVDGKKTNGGLPCLVRR